MLITTKGTFEKLDNYTLRINLAFPTIYLDKFDYKISIRSISFEAAKPFPASRISVCTTAVDKNALNPDQEILSFVPSRPYVFVNPRTPYEYKIQLKDVHTAEFFLTSEKTVDLIEANNCHIIFEITRDARIQ